MRAVSGAGRAVLGGSGAGIVRSAAMAAAQCCTLLLRPFS